MNFKKSDRADKTHPLSKFNSQFLIDNISSSSLLPSNYGKNIRLEQLIRESLIYGQKDTGSHDVDELIKTLNSNYSYNYLEDPPINIFTNVITFYGGDYLILPGISDGGDFILSNVLGAIFHTKNNLPEIFKKLVYQISLLTLSISDKVLKDVGLERYFEAETQNDEINLVEAENKGKYVRAINFTYEELELLCNELHIKSDIIKLLVLEIDDNLKTEDYNTNPIIAKPIIEVDDGYKVISTSNIHVALLHVILEIAISHKCLNELVKIYTSILWNNINVHLGLAGYELLNDFKKPDNNGVDIYEEYYRIDKDKIAYVSLEFDDGKNYNILHPFASRGEFDSVKLDKQKDQVIKELTEQFPQDKILSIKILAGLGREYLRAYNKHEKISEIIFPAYYFDIVMNSRNYEALDFWNYSQAKEHLTSTTQLSPFTDEINLYAMYKDLKDSFYMSDDKRPDFMMVDVGYSRKYIYNSYINEDRHSIIREDESGKFSNVLCIKIKGENNLYFPLTEIGKRLTKVITGYRQPIWVESLENISHIPNDYKGIYIEFLDAICYWIWQMTDYLSTVLIALGSNPITINFGLKEKSKFHEIEFKFDREEGVEEDFEITVNDNVINIIIPHKILPYLYGEDNLGEQILVTKILAGFNELAKNKLGNSILVPEIISEIIENVVNIPHKKKIYLLNTNNNLLLDPRGTSKVRYLQEYNVNKRLDELLPKLIEAKIIDDKTETIEDQNNFIKKMSSKIFLPDLIKEIEKYDSHYLLVHFIRLNESLIYKRNRQILNTPTMIACFVSKEKQIENLNEVFQDIDRTTLSIRCLIEHIAACPGKGKLMPSQENIDDLIAMMDQIINWGMIGDQVNYNLFEIKIDVLKSRRIGTDKILSEKVFQPFSVSKSSENVNDAIEIYANNYADLPEDNGKEIFTKKIEEAFKEEYGVTLTQLIQFSQALSGICFFKDPGCSIFYEDELISEIKKILPEIDKNEIIELLNHFSLGKREHIMDLPEGMETYDVFPWRYNRRLSLNQKPLVKVYDVEKKENKYYVGPRQSIKAGKIFTLFILFRKIKN